MTSRNIYLALAAGVPATPIPAGSCGSSLAFTIGWSFLTWATTDANKAEECKLDQRVEAAYMKCQFKTGIQVQYSLLRRSFPDLQGLEMPEEAKNYNPKDCRNGVPYELQGPFSPEEAAPLRDKALYVVVNNINDGRATAVSDQNQHQTQEEKDCDQGAVDFSSPAPAKRRGVFPRSGGCGK